MKTWGRFGNPSAVMSAFALERPAESDPREEAPSFEDVLREHGGDVHRLVWRLLGPGADEADVNDLCQQIFMALHVAFPKFRGDSKRSTWVYGVASRLVYRELRRRTRHRRMVKTLEAKASGLAERPPELAPQEARLELAEVWRCLMTIHPKKRMVFVLHEIEGMTGAEIAQVLGIKEPTVHTRLFYARRELMRALEATR